MKEQLEKLIRTVEETQLVERLIAARTTVKRVEICEKAKHTKEFQAFIQRYGEIADERPADDCIVSAAEFICTEQNAVAVAIILIIGRIDDIDMFNEEGCDFFIDALRSVEGATKEVAENIANLLGCDDQSQGLNITDFDLQAIIEYIF